LEVATGTVMDAGPARTAGGAADHGASADEIDRMIAARMRRASILYEPGRDVTILLGEAALRTRIGSPEIMERQRAHVAHPAATVSHAKIGVIPFERTGH
jgi:hypothetical protein